MSVTFIRGDITKLKVDAIVNAANNELRGGGGVDGAIHAAAGEEQLHAFCKTLGGCPTGRAKLSPGFNLPAKYIIHTVGPVWQGGGFHEKTLLTSCYISSLELARENHCKSVAFPLISAGAYGYPYNDALQIAYDTCRRFLNETKADMEIYIVLYLRERNYNANVRRRRDYSRFPDEAAFRRVAEYIREHYHFEAEETGREEVLSAGDSSALYEESASVSYDVAPDIKLPAPRKPAAPKAAAPEPAAEDSLEGAMPSARSAVKEKRLKLSTKRFQMAGGYAGKSPRKEDFSVEETFTQLLIRFMQEKHMDPPEVYNNACLDRKLFSKILSNMDYQPKKYTAVRLALGLKLSPEETDKLLNAAGFVLSHSKLTDLVISYCISVNKRDVWEVNGVLEDFGLTTI
ncbi:MAG: macro domain-containing protein [Acidaminococcaceae bacterium]|nr:macro domain-containing protein [Acidaminococcaceae bacterium]